MFSALHRKPADSYGYCVFFLSKRNRQRGERFLFARKKSLKGVIFYIEHHAQTFALEKNFFIIVCAIFQLQETMLASIYGIQEPRRSQYLGFLGARILEG